MIAGWFCIIILVFPFQKGRSVQAKIVITGADVSPPPSEEDPFEFGCETSAGLKAKNVTYEGWSLSFFPTKIISIPIANWCHAS